MRDYDPTLGRYMQADPLGLVDGPSIYGYALQNPQRFVDPRGEFVWAVPIIAGVFGGGGATTGTGASVAGVLIGAGILATAGGTPVGDGTSGSDTPASEASGEEDWCSDHEDGCDDQYDADMDNCNAIYNGCKRLSNLSGYPNRTQCYRTKLVCEKRAFDDYQTCRGY